ncbi:MAG: Na+/H+ antiporter NhaA [Beutenbergiaceae bacterium]
MKSGSGWLNRAIAAARTESGGALLLVSVAATALLWANSPLSQQYHDLWQMPASISVGDLAIELSLHGWVNDGLMVIFFFAIGLEVRQEFSIGSLQDRSKLMVPLIAGLTGVLIPTAIYLAIAGREAAAGWGAVIGTDTAGTCGGDPTGTRARCARPVSRLLAVPAGRSRPQCAVPG